MIQGSGTVITVPSVVDIEPTKVTFGMAQLPRYEQVTFDIFNFILKYYNCTVVNNMGSDYTRLVLQTLRDEMNREVENSNSISIPLEHFIIQPKKKKNSSTMNNDTKSNRNQFNNKPKNRIK